MKHKTSEKISLKVLRLENSPRDTEILRDLLTEAGYDLRMDCTMRKSEFVSLLRSHTYDVILSDFKCPGFDAFEALRFSIDICPHVPFICVSGSVSDETAIELIKRGAVDCVLKDPAVRLFLTIERALNKVKESTSRQQAEETLRQSEQRYRTLVTYSPDALYVHVDNRITFVNPGFCELLRADDASHLIGKSVFEIVPPEYHERIRERWNLMSAGQPAPLIEEKFTRLDGTLVDVEVSAVAIDWQGSTGVQVIARDITERKRSEKALRESEDRFRNAFEHSVVGRSITFPEGRMEVNRAFCDMVGYSRDELSTMTWQQLTHPEEIDRDQQIVNSIVSRERDSARWEKRFIHKEGRIVWADVSTVLQCDSAGKPLYLITTAIDITDRKRMEETLKASELRFRLAATSLTDVIYEWDLKERVDWYGDIDGMMGYPAGEFPRTLTAWAELLHPDEKQSVFAAVDRQLKGVAPYKLEYRIKRKDDDWRWWSARGTVWRDENDQPRGWIGSVTDITERKRAEEVVRDSEERFRMVFEHVFDGVSIYSEDADPSKRKLIECNDRYAAMAGRSREELLQLGSTLGLQKTHGHTSNKNRLESLTMGMAYQGAFSWIRPDGKDNVVEYVGMPITWRGKPYSIGIDRDITERKKAEQELRLMAQTIASARDCISITDLHDRIIFVNEAFQNTYGYTAEELLGRDISIVRSPLTSRSISARILPETMDNGWHGELLNRRKDGSDFPVELWTSVVKDEDGIPVAMVGVARDITIRKAAEEHLKQSEEQFRLIAENVADMIAVVDLEGRRIYNSPSYKSILGTPELLKATDGFHEIHPDDVAIVKQVFQETVRTGIGQRLEYRFLLNDGSIRNIDSKGSVIRDTNGKISQVIIVSRDVTEEKKLAAQFLRAQRMESIGTLAGGIAHDLNNVLAPIMMSIEVLRGKILDPGGQNILGTIETSAKRGSDIVKQVLAFGRGVKGEHILLQLKHVINELVKIFSQTFPKSIDIKTDIPRDLWTVSADPTQMHQVLLNMMVNARDAMPGGGTLTISAENINLDETYSRMHLEAKPGAYVCIVITDTGVGIPADIREKIFEPFFTTKEIGIGTGLGLSTSLAIVRSHEGFINLYSEEGKGTTFRIYIPATKTAPNVAAASEEVELPTGNGELILIIDDEAAIREITKETVQANGYKAMTASDGAEGVAIFADNKDHIKVVITDIMMPVMDGTATILALKKINPEVKIIAASGLTTKGQITTPSDSNVQAFLTKPYTAEKLLKTLAEVLK